MARITYHPFDDTGPFEFWSSESFAWPKLLDWLSGDDEEASDSFALVQMYNADGDEIEVVTENGEPIGVLDNPHIGLLDLRAYETPEETALREGAEDASREMHTEARREWRTPANDIFHRIARRRANV